MDWNGTRKDNRRALKRIVAVLFALASLADRASTRHGLLRGCVLWILRSAETIARDFVMDMALDQGALPLPAVLLIPALHGGDAPADAMRLAESFRALAVQLDRLVDGNPGRSEMGIARIHMLLAASVVGRHLPAGTRSGRRQLRLAPQFAGERRDSS